MVEAVVVEDSQFMRVQIREILEAGGITVVAEAHNGKAGVEAVCEHEPDVVTMDVKMPGMDGIEAVERIMSKRPTPTLMLSQYTADGNETTFEALNAGAVDFFPKPDSDTTTTLVEYADELVESVRVVAAADVTRHATVDGETQPIGTETPDVWDGPTPPTLVVAASTGGPSVVEELLEAFPETSGLRVLVVQHMPEQFTSRFATRLDRSTALTFSEAADGAILGPDEGVVARGGYHLEVADDIGPTLELTLTTDPPVNSVRPAADVTLESVANTVAGPVVAVVLTGMGKDGATGIEHVHAAGGTVLVQNPESATVETMPTTAIETGAVDEVLHETELPAAVLDALA